MRRAWSNFHITKKHQWILICAFAFDLDCKLKNTFGTGMCKSGLGDAFYRRFLSLVCAFVLKLLSQDLSNDIFSGIVRKMLRLLATSAAFCVVMVSFHRQKGWGQHAQIALRRAESFFNP